MSIEKEAAISLGLTPAGHLILHFDDSDEIAPAAFVRQISDLFSIGFSIGLLRLGLTNFTNELPASFSFWREFAQLFIMQICKQNQLEATDLAQFNPPVDEISKLLTQAPFMRGSEYLNLEHAIKLWDELNLALVQELKIYDGDLKAYMASFHAVWNTIGRVCFHLAENKNNLTSPFAFLATYTTGVSKTARTQHLPLGRALEEYAGRENKAQLLTLLLPVQRAAEKSKLLRQMVDNSTIFKPLAWGAREAYMFLQDIPLFEEAGIMVRVPNWWNVKKPPRPNITVAVGNSGSVALGLNALLDFDLHFALPDGENITREEFEALLQSTEKLVQFRGQWLQVDSEKLKDVLGHWKQIESQVKKQGLSFAQGLRLLAGMQKQQAEDDLAIAEINAWSNVVAGEWLNETLKVLRNPELGGSKQSQLILQQYLNAVLRSYQQLGVQWLWWLYSMNLGGCLADDMGLGKTIQVLSLLLLAKHQKLNVATNEQVATHLLVLPVSLLGNWQAEAQRFAPDLKIYFAHNSFGALESPDLADYDLVITTYSMLSRLSWLTEVSWEIVILDEAQAIKNPSAKQSRLCKALKSKVRFALTGTPIENSILDLWSIFDFVAPGLLGSNREFANYHKKKAPQLYAAIRQLVSPYILRRLKSDKSIINDLPDKTEMQTYCTLSKEQIGLYQQSVNDLNARLEMAKREPQYDIQRRGLVLSYLLRFKQICNYPSQWLGHGAYEQNSSGKFLRLQEICSVIVAKQEKLLVFTQFREIIPALSEYLAKIFGRGGLYLHGQTSIKERAKMVAQFQAEDGPPFFVLSLKAGGTGLNLTAASHVIHFDRWWNPAVENQATDRAYRIGQKKNVLVHKFICQGTIEEKIDAMINSKKQLSSEMIDGGGDKELVLTELSDSELIQVVSLDIHRAIGAD